MKRLSLLVMIAALSIAPGLPGRAEPVECVLSPDSELTCPLDEAGSLLDGIHQCVTTPRVGRDDTVDHACATSDHEQGRYPEVTVCVTDGAIATVAWWYDGLGPLVCGATGEWWSVDSSDYSGFPSVCVWTGANTPDDPLACAGRDASGDDGEPVHCPIWTAGSSTCFQE